MIEKYTNADSVIVSKHRRLLKQIKEQYEKNSGNGEKVGDKENIARTSEYGGLEIYVDSDNHLWAGVNEWVVPIAIEE